MAGRRAEDGDFAAWKKKAAAARLTVGEDGAIHFTGGDGKRSDFLPGRRATIAGRPVEAGGLSADGRALPQQPRAREVVVPVRKGFRSPLVTTSPRRFAAMNVKAGFNLIKESFQEWQKDGALDLGAALAYYTIFSLAPLLLIVIAVAGLVWGREAVQGQLVGQIQGLMGQQGAQAIQTMIANAGKHGSGVLATIIGVVTILFGATGVFVQLQTALNKIWNVEPKPGARDLELRQDPAALLRHGAGDRLPAPRLAGRLDGGDRRSAPGRPGCCRAPRCSSQVLTFVVSFALITLLFAMIFKVLPDVEIGWRDVWIGAGVTALLFTLGKFLIGLYLGKSSVASTYGAAGSLVIVLLWIYYSSQILFLGAEFTQVYATHYGSQIQPEQARGAGGGEEGGGEPARVAAGQRKRGRRSAPG